MLTLDRFLRFFHVIAVIVYLGGGLFLQASVGRAMRRIPPGQAAILGGRIGTDLTYMAWSALAAWGVTGYWILYRLGLLAIASPHTLFVERAYLNSSRGVATLIMVASWYLLVISSAIMTFKYRKQLEIRVEPGDAEIAVEEALRTIASGARGISVLSTVNLALIGIAFVAATFYF